MESELEAISQHPWSALASGLLGDGAWRQVLPCLAAVLVSFIEFLFVKGDSPAGESAKYVTKIGGVIFPIFFTRVKEAVGFDSAIRYTALIIGVFLAAACLLVTSPLSRTRWNTQQTWFQVSLFRDYTFSLYTAAAFFIMFVYPNHYNTYPVHSSSSN